MEYTFQNYNQIQAIVAERIVKLYLPKLSNHK